ncbi:uncharacterized protein LOC122243472 [Penaeus japonicus]|uniref:uncharacterized protein LOC122243472 n=1 Tax=Penaeus japonicus TaxID=27405 RepID=UPI001C71203B|nr:uncharacterized protein LOC122243472 [Penaeus japonicus]XP_042857012.1 uncharacterized protein LOC122243472 [Penaeus japonicus]
MRPKSLFKQAAETFAKQVINRCLPSLRQCWVHRQYSICAIGSRIDEAKKLLVDVKSWYDKNEWFGNPHSVIRTLVGRGFSEVLRVLLIHDLPVPLFVFILQAMFCNEVESLSPVMCDHFTKAVSQTVGNFLQAMAPFTLETLHTTSILFDHPMPVVILLQNSPHLREIHLRHNLSDYVLLHLKNWCPLLEFITLVGRNNISEDYLFATFFRGLKKAKVMEYVDNKSACPLSFSKLKRVRLELHRKNFDEFLFFLQYFYPGIQCNIKKIISGAGVYPVAFKSLLDPPSCLNGKGTFQVDTVRFVVPATAGALKEYDPSVTYSVVRHFSFSCRDISKSHYLDALSKIKDLLKLLGCSSVFLAIYPNAVNTTLVPTVLLQEFGPKLKELHISVHVPIDNETLHIYLNACPNVNLFCIKVTRFIFDSVNTKAHLRPLLHLETLSIETEYHMERDLYTQIIENIISAAPRLTTLELIGQDIRKTVRDLALSGKLSEIQILSLYWRMIGNSFDDWIFSFCIFIGTHLSALKVLMLNHFPEETLLKFKAYFHYTDLELVERRLPFVSDI